MNEERLEDYYGEYEAWEKDQEIIVEELSTMSWSYPDDQEARHTATLVRTTLSLEEVEEWAKDKWPTYRCMHSYDCCGHWYQGAYPRVLLVDEYYSTYLITISRYQNV